MKVTAGSVSVRYYPETVNGCKYWTIYHYTGGKRKKERCKTEDDARDRATLIAKNLSAGIVENVTGADASAVQRLRAAEASVPQAVDEWLTLRKKLPGVSISDLIANWERNHAGITPKTTGEILAEMVDYARRQGRSKGHVDGIRLRCGVFARAHPGPLADLQRSVFDNWLNGMGWRPVNFTNNVRSILAMVNFAKRKKYLAPDWDTLEGIPLPACYTAPVVIYSPEDMQTILDAIPDRLRAAIAIGAFAGLRQSEILRLNWEDVREDHIVVGLQKVRSAGRRIVPLRENLRAWINPVRGTGRVVNYTSQATFVQAAKSASPIKLLKNGLRHSYISYRMAEIQDAPRVALECGNSPSKIFAHYREIVTKAQAATWFAIAPQNSPKAENILDSANL